MTRRSVIFIGIVIPLSRSPTSAWRFSRNIYLYSSSRFQGATGISDAPGVHQTQDPLYLGRCAPRIPWNQGFPREVPGWSGHPRWV